MKNIYLEVKGRILRHNGDTMEYDAANITTTDSPFFVNNTLPSLFCECSLTATGIKIFSANGNTARKAVIDTEFSLNKSER